MGTRRSKHNKGRKPLYKEHRRHLIEDDKPAHEKARMIPGTRRVRREATATPELADVVAAYLEKRSVENARKFAGQVFPAPTKSPELRVINGDVFNPHLADDNPNLVQASESDVLLQLFVERKISGGQLHAGRRWQRIREQATIQPNACLLARAWGGRPYQARGNISDAQVDAMTYRRDFLSYAGPAALAFLDFCLDADRGADELTRLFKIDRDQLAAIIDDLLSKLCTLVNAQRAAA